MTRRQIATKRGVQTLRDGLIVVMIMAALAAFGDSLTAESWGEWLNSWQHWTWAAFQAAGTAAVSWLQRLYRDAAGIPPETTEARRALEE